jgi:antitoxin HicB
MLAYPVELTQDTNGTLMVAFPDFSEAATFGEDEADALLRAVDALETVLAARIDDREPIPLPQPAGNRRSVALPALTAAKILLYRAMREAGVRKADLARRLGWQGPQVDRLLDLGHASRLDQIEQALAAPGKRLTLDVADAA